MECPICKGVGKIGSLECGFCKGTGIVELKDKHDANTEEMTKPSDKKTTEAALKSMPLIASTLGKLDGKMEYISEEQKEMRKDMGEVKIDVAEIKMKVNTHNNEISKVRKDAEYSKWTRKFCESMPGKWLIRVVVTLVIAGILSLAGLNAWEFLQKNGLF